MNEESVLLRLISPSSAHLDCPLEFQTVVQKAADEISNYRTLNDGVTVAVAEAAEAWIENWIDGQVDGSDDEAAVVRSVVRHATELLDSGRAPFRGNLVRSRRRSSSRFKSRLQDLQGEDVDLFEIALSRETAEAVQVLALHLEGASAKEIAMRQGSTPSAIRTLLRDVRSRLMASLDGMERAS